MRRRCLREAYLDVTENKTGLATATVVARTIRGQIRQELSLTASAGVAPNKFLAKLASDWCKPDGLFVVQPEDVDAFLLPLPVGRLPGVGKVSMIRRLSEKLWLASHQEPRVARTVVLKLKTSEFKILTRSLSLGSSPSSCEELTGIALKLRERVDLDPQQRYRLVGVGLSNFHEPEDTAAQPVLFD